MLRKECCIVVVEDDREVGMMIERIIEGETPHRAHLYASGIEMLQHLKEIHHFQPDLFILDYRLPQLTGVELCWIIRKMEGLADVPIILISANELSLPPKYERCTSLFIKKPFDIEEFLQAIESELNKS